MTQADKLIFENVRFLGNQDTLYVKTARADTVARAYFKDCYVEGDVDFIFGRATFVLDACEIHYVTARQGSSGATSWPRARTRAIPTASWSSTACSPPRRGRRRASCLGPRWDEGGASNATVYPAAGAAIYPNGQALVRDSILGRTSARQSLARGGHHRAAV